MLFVLLWFGVGGRSCSSFVASTVQYLGPKASIFGWYSKVPSAIDLTGPCFYKSSRGPRTLRSPALALVAPGGASRDLLGSSGLQWGVGFGLDSWILAKISIWRSVMISILEGKNELHRKAKVCTSPS